MCADVGIDAFLQLMFSSSLPFICHFLVLQDCTVYETENKILHVVSFCLKMSNSYKNINNDSQFLACFHHRKQGRGTMTYSTMMAVKWIDKNSYNKTAMLVYTVV